MEFFIRLGSFSCYFFLFLFQTSCFLFVKAPLPNETKLSGEHRHPKNIVLFIGDGMGKNQLRVASESRFGGEEPQLFMFSLPVFTEITTEALGGVVTDSAASASAMATGRKYAPGQLSFDADGDGKQPETLAEFFKNQGKSLGFITTDQLIGATPSAFAVHLPDRALAKDIVKNYLFSLKPQIMMGGNAKEFDEGLIRQSGAIVLRDKASFKALEGQKSTPPMILGLFGFDRIPYVRNRDDSIPSLPEMARLAQNILAHDPDGYFLLVEGGRIDYAAHENNIDYLIDEVLEFDDTIKSVIRNDKQKNETLYIVTADHETGGLTITHNDAKNSGNLKPFNIQWHFHEHTKEPVFLFAEGPGSELFKKARDNTDVYKIIRQIFSQK